MDLILAFVAIVGFIGAVIGLAQAWSQWLRPQFIVPLTGKWQRAKNRIRFSSEQGLGSTIIRMNNSIEGTIEEIVRLAIIPYIKGEPIEILGIGRQEPIEVLGIGERLHTTFALRNVMILHLLEPLAKAGFKALLLEFLLKDIPPSEWNIVYRELKEYSTKDPINTKLNALKALILNNPSRLPKLFFNLNQGIEAEYRDVYQDDLLLLIIRLYDLGVNLYGMINSTELTGTDLDIMLRIKASGEQEAVRLLKEKGKFMIYGGDVHVNCKPLQPSKSYPNAARIIFGNTLFEACRYLNLTILTGTAKTIEEQKDGFGERGYNFYHDEFQTLKPGMARIFIIRAEDEHRILLLYNDALDGMPGRDIAKNTETTRS